MMQLSGRSRDWPRLQGVAERMATPLQRRRDMAVEYATLQHAIPDA
jgi:hypothetical protein